GCRATIPPPDRGSQAVRERAEHVGEGSGEFSSGAERASRVSSVRFTTLDDESFREQARRIDRHATERLAVEGPEVRPITGDQPLTLQPNGRGEHGPVFLRERERRLQGRGMRVGGGEVHTREQGVQNRYSSGCLRDEIAPRLLHDVTIRPALVSRFDQQCQQPSYGAIGLGGGKENLGVEKDPHPPSVSGRTSASSFG